MNDNLLICHKNKPGVYIFLLNPKINDTHILYNFGSTKNITERMATHRTNFKNINHMINIMIFYQTLDYSNLESILRNNPYIKEHKIKYGTYTEMFTLENNEESFNKLRKEFNNIVKQFQKQSAIIVKDKELLIEEERTKQKCEDTKQKDKDIILKDREILLKQEETKQKEIDSKKEILLKQEETKQMEIELEKLKLQHQLELAKLNLTNNQQTIPIENKEPKIVINGPSTSSIENTTSIVPIKDPETINNKKNTISSTPYYGLIKSTDKQNNIKYRVHVRHSGTRTYLGLYEDILIAAAAYDCKKKIIDPECTKLNNINLPIGYRFNNEINRVVKINN
jgi:hypothetical protein